MLEQERLCCDRSHTPWAQKLRAGDQHVDGQSEKFTHLQNATTHPIPCKTARRERIASYYEFATHTLVERKYRLLFSSSSHRGKPGPKGPAAELIAAIVEMKRRNPGFGCVRIAQQIAHAFGVQIDKDVVRRVLANYYRPGSGTEGPSWLSFIGHAQDSLWSIDLFRCESILLRSHWVLLVIDVFTRRIVGFGVEYAGIDGVSVCRMFNCASASHSLPRHDG